MSDFEELKKRIPAAARPALRHHHTHQRKATAVPAKGVQAKHDALNLPPGRHQLTPGGGALSTYRDLPKPDSAVAAPPKVSAETPIVGEAREKRMATLRKYLWAQVEAGRMELAQAEVAMMQFQEALDEGLPSYEE